MNLKCQYFERTVNTYLTIAWYLLVRCFALLESDCPASSTKHMLSRYQAIDTQNQANGNRLIETMVSTWEKIWLGIFKVTIFYQNLPFVIFYLDALSHQAQQDQYIGISGKASPKSTLLVWPIKSHQNWLTSMLICLIKKGWLEGWITGPEKTYEGWKVFFVVQIVDTMGLKREKSAKQCTL